MSSLSGRSPAFADFRCAAICFSDIAQSVLEDAGTKEGTERFDMNKGTLLYGIRPVEMTLNDFELKVEQKYFDDVCYEKRLQEMFPETGWNDKSPLHSSRQTKLPETLA
ncbi:DUF5448 family protein (plasmid) [Salmonella enterica]|nr:DUF5448 family protein [Salmonella enterica]